ncbi:MAG TPA: Yip1 family protein [Myxococcales bacterium]|jgi:hypothetical protein
MIAKCARCQYVFTTDRFGRQFCPSCGAELVLPAPGGSPPPAGPPSQPSGPSAPPAQPGEAPVPSHAATGGAGASARCSAHPDRPAKDICARCGAFACGDCLQPGPDGQPQCPACRARGGEIEPTPWEERDQRGLVAAYIETVKRSVVDPVRLFERMRVDNTDGVLSYCWITVAIGALGGQAWQALFAAVGFNSLGGGGGPKLPEGHPLSSLMAMSNSPFFNLALGIAVALMAPLSLYLNAGIFHLGLLLFKGAKNGFNATLRAVSYASGPNLLQLVPLCGGAIGGIWVLVLYVIGLSRVHRTSTGVAIAAVVVPLVLLTCCACGLGAVALALGGIAAANAVQQATQ